MPLIISKVELAYNHFSKQQPTAALTMVLCIWQSSVVAELQPNVISYTSLNKKEALWDLLLVLLEFIPLPELKINYISLHVGAFKEYWGRA